jgi:hypothetical protein
MMLSRGLSFVASEFESANTASRTLFCWAKRAAAAAVLAGVGAPVVGDDPNSCRKICCGS